MLDNKSVIGRSESAVSTNRVLRNTYAMLAMTMVPTVLGAFIGLSTNFSWLMGMGSIMRLVVMLGVFYGMIWLVHKNANNSAGVWLLFAFTFVMGFFLGPILQYSLNVANGGELVALAAGGTAAIFFTLAGIASNAKRDFSNLTKFLTIGFVVLIVMMIANAFLHVPALSLTISALFICFSSAFILYEINQVVRGGETNYVLATMSVYISLYNIFTSLLHLLLSFAGGDD